MDAHDIKLALDVECQALIETCIHESFPDHAILGEEGATPKQALNEFMKRVMGSIDPAQDSNK